MSAIVRRKPRKSLSFSQTALWVVLGLAAAFFLVRYGQEVLLEHDLNRKAAAQQESNAQLRDENARLAALLEYYKSDKYIEQRAREDLNLRRPDETVLIPIDTTPEAGDRGAPLDIPRSEEAAEPEATPTAERANWQKWLDLFSPGP